MVTESDTWKKIDEVARANSWFAERFEDPTRWGCPDVYLGTYSHRAWIENKSNGITFKGYQKGQLAWAIRASNAGERVFTLVATDAGRYRVYNQAAVGRAALNGEPFPPYLHATESLSNILGFCLGLPRR